MKLACAACMLVALPCLADVATAKKFFASGEALFQRGKFVEAAKEFERANEEAPTPEFQYNIGTAYDKAGDRKRALEAYRKYIASAPDASSVVRARAEVIARELAESQPKPVQSFPFVEPITKHAFQTAVTFDGAPYVLVGVGARKVMSFKVYSMGLYVEDEPARKAFPELAAKAGGADRATLERGSIGYQFLVLGDFGRAAVLHFVRAVSAKDTREAYRAALGDTISDKAPPDLKRDAEAFLLLFGDVKEGEEISIHTTRDGQIFVESGGKRQMGPKNPRLSHDLWTIWLGDKPISTDLKKHLLDRIETLAR